MALIVCPDCGRFGATLLGVAGAILSIMLLRKGGTRRTVKIAALIASLLLIPWSATIGFVRWSEAQDKQAALDAKVREKEQKEQAYAEAVAKLEQMDPAANPIDTRAGCERVAQLGAIPQTSTSRCAGAYARLALAALDAGKSEEAEKAYEAASKLDRTQSEVARAGAGIAVKVLTPQLEKKLADAVQRAKSEETLEDAVRIAGEANTVAQQALTLAPDNKATVALADRARKLLDKLSGQKAKYDAEQARLAAIRGKKPISSAWDGSVREVKQHLERVLKDPDSVQYVEWSEVNPMTWNGQPYWGVRVMYRAKNSFGGYVLASQVALMQQGMVIDMVDY